jgi:hypothetical protein
VVSQLDRAGFICGTMAPMAKKKTQGKKHKFKYAEASPNVQVGGFLMVRYRPAVILVMLGAICGAL